MRDPELRSPQEWADELREAASDNAGYVASITDCRELADRMDDLADALTMLGVVVDETGWTAAEKLLAKYEAKED